MRILFAMLVAIVTTSCSAAVPAGNSGGCPYLPAFKQLQADLAAMSAGKAAAALERYAASHENPEGCEATEVDRLLSEREIELFSLKHEGQKIPAAQVYRCDELNPKTAHCVGPIEDGTAHPAYASGIKPFPKLIGTRQAIVMDRPGTVLIEVYSTSLAAVLDGQAAKPVARQGAAFTVPEGGVLIATFRSQGFWRYRKVVWYFE